VLSPRTLLRKDAAVSKKKEEKRYTATDAAIDTVDIVVVTPVVWLFSNTVGLVLDL
jgi:hypothetical protein